MAARLFVAGPGHPTYGTGVEKTDKSGARYFLFRTGPRAVSDAPAPIHSHTEGAANPASAEERDRVYRAFLKLLGSTGVDPALDGRGVPDHSRLRKWYRFLPLQGRAKICRRMIADGLEPLMAHTPGFFVKAAEKGNPYWTFAGRPGLAIPVTDHAGLVVGLMIRPVPAAPVVSTNGCRRASTAGRSASSACTFPRGAVLPRRSASPKGF